jgi:hypothetical protein
MRLAVLDHDKGLIELTNFSAGLPKNSLYCDFPGKRNFGYCNENDIRNTSCVFSNSFDSE